MTTNVVARFAKFESYFYAISILVCFAYLFASVYGDMSGRPLGIDALVYEWSALRWRIIALIGILLGPFIILLQLIFLWLLIAKGGRAVWISDGKLVFFNNYVNGIFSAVPIKDIAFTRVPLQDIDHLSTIPAQPLRCSAVVLHLKDGKRKYISALLLADNAEILMPRLSAALKQCAEAV